MCVCMWTAVNTAGRTRDNCWLSGQQVLNADFNSFRSIAYDVGLISKHTVVLLWCTKVCLRWDFKTQHHDFNILAGGVRVLQLCNHTLICSVYGSWATRGVPPWMACSMLCAATRPWLECFVCNERALEVEWFPIWVFTQPEQNMLLREDCASVKCNRCRPPARLLVECFDCSKCGTCITSRMTSDGWSHSQSKACDKSMPVSQVQYMKAVPPLGVNLMASCQLTAYVYVYMYVYIYTSIHLHSWKCIHIHTLYIH